MSCKQWDVAIIPFPFVDTPKSKPRPVLILSQLMFIEASGHAIAAMITSSAHPTWIGDTQISDLSSAGLQKESIIRLKLFTLDLRMAPKVIGSLSQKDRKAFQENIHAYMM